MQNVCAPQRSPIAVLDDWQEGVMREGVRAGSAVSHGRQDPLDPLRPVRVESGVCCGR